MLLNKEQIESIHNREITYVKNFVLLKREYDFNLISKILEEQDNRVLTKTNVGNLRDVYQMLNVTNYLQEFKIFFDFLSKTFKFNSDPKNGVELYFNFAAQVGAVHDDIENVFIIGLKGKTVYRIYGDNNIDYEINKGDMVFIPPGIKHKAIALTPRIIASIGFYDR